MSRRFSGAREGAKAGIVAGMDKTLVHIRIQQVTGCDADLSHSLDHRTKNGT